MGQAFLKNCKFKYIQVDPLNSRKFGAFSQLRDSVYGLVFLATSFIKVEIINREANSSLKLIQHEVSHLYSGKAIGRPSMA